MWILSKIKISSGTSVHGEPGGARPSGTQISENFNSSRAFLCSRILFVCVVHFGQQITIVSTINVISRVPPRCRMRRKLRTYENSNSSSSLSSPKCAVVVGAWATASHTTCNTQTKQVTNDQHTTNTYAQRLIIPQTRGAPWSCAWSVPL